MTELRFNVDRKFNQTLSDLVESNDSAKNTADVVQRAVATYKYFGSLPEGAKIQIVGGDGQVLVRDVAVP